MWEVGGQRNCIKAKLHLPQQVKRSSYNTKIAIHTLSKENTQLKETAENIAELLCYKPVILFYLLIDLPFSPFIQGGTRVPEHAQES